MQKHAPLASRSDSLMGSLSAVDEQKRLNAEVDHLKRTLVQSHYTIAELRVALAEAHERCDEMGRELVEHTMAELPGMGGALSMMANLDGVSLDLHGASSRSAPRLHRFATVGSSLSLDASRFDLLCRWPDLRSDRLLPASKKEASQEANAATVSGKQQQQQGTVPVEASLARVVLRLAKDEGPLGLLRNGLLALLLFIVVARLVLQFILWL